MWTPSPYVSHPPDVIYVVSVPRPSSFFTALPLPYIILNANWKIKSRWGLLMRLGQRLARIAGSLFVTSLLWFNSPVLHPCWSAPLHAGVILDVWRASFPGFPIFIFISLCSQYNTQSGGVVKSGGRLGNTYHRNGKARFWVQYIHICSWAMSPYVHLASTWHHSCDKGSHTFPVFQIKEGRLG